jgi:DNA-binding SARP family transcriptional activator
MTAHDFRTFQGVFVMVDIRLNLLGGFELLSDRKDLQWLKGRKTRALLSYLSAQAGKMKSREHLCALLWSRVEEVQARTSLRQALAKLRRVLRATDLDLVTLDDHVGLPNSFSTDVKDFERAVLEGDIERAATLYRGDFLEGVSAGGEAFEYWLLMERERLRSLAADSIAQLIGTAKPLPRACINVALRILMNDPIHETLHRTLMSDYMARGDYAEAIRQYRRCAHALSAELKIRPCNETEDLLNKIQNLQRGARYTGIISALP